MHRAGRPQGGLWAQWGMWWRRSENPEWKEPREDMAGWRGGRGHAEVLSFQEVPPHPVQPQRSQVRHMDSSWAVRGHSRAVITGHSRGHASIERDSGGVLGLSCPPPPRVQEHVQTVKGAPEVPCPIGFLRSRWQVEVTVLKVGKRGPHLLREIAQALPSPLNAMVSMYTELSPSPPHPSPSVPALGTRVP